MKNTWDFYAPVYDLLLSGSKRAYAEMSERIRVVIRDRRVLEIACGTGSLAKASADVSRSYIATDLSEQMLAQAQRGRRPEQLIFSKADGAALPFAAGSFDVVILSNALHFVAEPGRTLRECSRVLSRRGVLIAPGFVRTEGTRPSLLVQAMAHVGLELEPSWDEKDYKRLLAQNGWKVRRSDLLNATLPLMYTECIRKQHS